MAITFVHGFGNDVAAATSCSVVVTGGTTAGNVLIVWISASDNTGAAVTDTLGNTYTPAGSWFNGTVAFVRFYYVLSCLGGANTVKCATTNNSYTGMAVGEWNPGGGTPTFDQVTAIKSNTSGSPTGTAWTPAANSIAAAGITNAGASTTHETVVSPWLESANSHNGNQNAAAEYKLAPSGSQTPSWTQNTSEASDVGGISITVSSAVTDPYPAGYGNPTIFMPTFEIKQRNTA